MNDVTKLAENERILVRYLTIGGAVVMVVGRDPEYDDEGGIRSAWKCCGCGEGSDLFWQGNHARETANRHAGECRSMSPSQGPAFHDLQESLDRIRHELAQRPDQLAARDLAETVGELVEVVRDGLDNVADQVHTLIDHVDEGQAALCRELDAGLGRIGASLAEPRTAWGRWRQRRRIARWARQGRSWGLRRQHVFNPRSYPGREIPMPEFAARIVCRLSFGRLDYWPVRQSPVPRAVELDLVELETTEPEFEAAVARAAADLAEQEADR